MPARPMPSSTTPSKLDQAAARTRPPIPAHTAARQGDGRGSNRCHRASAGWCEVIGVGRPRSSSGATDPSSPATRRRADACANATVRVMARSGRAFGRRNPSCTAMTRSSAANRSAGMSPYRPSPPS
jgi:hypothetical protein